MKNEKALAVLPAVVVVVLSYLATPAPASNHTKEADCDRKADLRDAVCHGMWSGKTTSLFNTWTAPDTNPERRLRLTSPDGRKTLVVDGFQVRLIINGKRFWTPFGQMHDAEVAWAPDSARMFVTWSESGELGVWHVQVFDITENGLKEIPEITRFARRDILRRERGASIPKWVKSEYRDMWNSLAYCEPDMMGSQWLNGSKEILVAARAGPDSGCKYMGDIVVYRLEASTGEILQTYTGREAHQAFGDEDLPAVDDEDDDL